MGNINNGIKENNAEQTEKNITKRFVDEREPEKDIGLSPKEFLEKINYEQEDVRETSKKRKRRKKTVSPKIYNVTPLLTVLSLVVLVSILIFAWFYNKNYIKNVYVDLEKAFETNLTEEDNGKTENKEDSSELLTVTENDYDSGMEFPLSNVYDSKGNLTVEVIKNSDGTVEKAIYNTYENGTLVTCKEYSSDVKLLCITEYTENGKRFYEIVLDTNGNFNGYTVTEYDASDKTLKHNTFTYGGVLSGYDIYQYGESGLLERIDNYSAYDTALSYIIYKYDEIGNNVERLSYDQDNNLEYREKCTYDEENRLIEEQKYVNDVCRSYTEYIYDEYGNTESHIYYLINEDEMIYKEITQK